MTCCHHNRISSCRVHNRVAACRYHNGVPACAEHNRISAVINHNGVTACIEHDRIASCRLHDRVSAVFISGNFDCRTCRAVAPFAFFFAENRRRDDFVFHFFEASHDDNDRFFENYAGRFEFNDFADYIFAFCASVILGIVNLHRDLCVVFESFSRNLNRN